MNLKDVRDMHYAVYLRDKYRKWVRAQLKKKHLNEQFYDSEKHYLIIDELPGRVALEYRAANAAATSIAASFPPVFPVLTPQPPRPYFA